MLLQELANLGELRLAVHERGRWTGQVAAPSWRGRDRRDRRIVREDRLLEAPQPRTGLERQLLREDSPSLLKHLQRVRLPTASVERQHQLPPQSLSERALLERSAYGGHELGVLSERESRLEPLFQRIEPKRVQPPGLSRGPGRVRKAEQRRAAPEGERLRDRVRGSRRIAGAESGARSGDQLFELGGVDDRVFERVSVCGEPDRVRPQRPAQPGHVVLHGVSGRGRKIASPQRLDERVRSHDSTRA